MYLGIIFWGIFFGNLFDILCGYIVYIFGPSEDFMDILGYPDYPPYHGPSKEDWTIS